MVVVHALGPLLDVGQTSPGPTIALVVPVDLRLELFKPAHRPFTPGRPEIEELLGRSVTLSEAVARASKDSPEEIPGQIEPIDVPPALLFRPVADRVVPVPFCASVVALHTHYIEEAERLCDRVAILDQGRKVEVASPDELTNRGTDTIEITLADPPETAPTLDLPDVLEASMRDGHLEIVARGGGAVLPPLLRQIEDAGHEITAVDVRRASLEEVFVDMTRTEGAVQQ